MPTNNNRRLIISGGAVVVVVLVALAVANSYFPSQSTVATRIGSASQSSTLASMSTFSLTSSVTATVSSGFSIVGARCGGTCTINVPWTSIYHMYPNFTDLATNSVMVLLANVTSEAGALANGIPITEYNITVTQELVGNAALEPGTELPILQVGGTADGVTMNLIGGPLLTVGGTYVLFLSPPGGIVFGDDSVTASESTSVINGTTITFTNSVTGTTHHSPGDPLAQYVLPVDDGGAQITVGGPQGVFYVQDGNVYSLNNAYPQADGWLPLKVSGVPLAQFIQEVQSAATSTTTASAASTVSSSSAAEG